MQKNSMQKIKIITSTVREGSKGISLARWITDKTKEKECFEVELLDLAAINLPMMNEPYHPKLKNYQFNYTKKWSKTIDETDAFIIVLAEYNYGMPAAIKNAIDYLHQEWQYKPMAIMSYGGVSGGLRSSQMMKQVVTTLNMMPIAQQVNIPFFDKKIDEKGVFQPDEIIVKSAEVMLAELEKWSEMMQCMREDS